MNRSIADVALRGAISGAAASVPQAVIGKLEDILILPPHENADIAPRLVERLAEMLGEDVTEEQKWVLGTLYHVGYGAGWGALYALAAERLRLSPVLGGALLGCLIYGITFPRWGGAVQTGAERPPERRSSRMTFVDWSVALSYGIATGLMYDRISRAFPWEGADAAHAH